MFWFLLQKGNRECSSPVHKKFGVIFIKRSCKMKEESQAEITSQFSQKTETGNYS